MTAFGREICGDLTAATRREWLVTNGLGGYACGTVSGVLTRKYHGLLVAATAPPGKRVLLLAALESSVQVGDRITPLSTNRWMGGAIAPRGDRDLESFRLEGTVPVWSHAIGPILLERRVWMVPDSNTTCIRWTLRRGGPVTLRMQAMATCRSHHHVAPEPRAAPRTVQHGAALEVRFAPGGAVLWLHSDKARVTPADGDQYHGYLLSVEQARGYDAIDSHHHVANIEAQLEPGASITVVASTAQVPAPDGARMLAERRAHEERCLAHASLAGTDPDDPVARLVLAADQFVVRREAPPSGVSILAGYPWFEDWGRDTMIALPGILLATGRHDEAAQTLRTFARALDGGMIPNRFPDEGGAPEYHTVDATLWMVNAIAEHAEAIGSLDLVRELWSELQSIIQAHLDGTRHGIRVDPSDGLLRAGEPGVQLTWMDAKVGDWVVTPRVGKPVEISALWHAACARMAQWAEALGRPGDLYRVQRDKCARGFSRFWNPHRRCLFDVLDGPHGDDPSLRPNQLLAVSLTPSPVPEGQRRSIVDRCAESLLTSMGMRTLAPRDPGYCGVYGDVHADQSARDAVYHQGTVWPWLIGPFVDAYLAVGGRPEQARTLIAPILLHLADAGLGSISEIADGDPPHRPDGCPAQAWSVAEVLRIHRKLIQDTRCKTPRNHRDDEPSASRP